MHTWMYKANDELLFRVGQMKVPLSDSNLKSPASMPYRPLTRQITSPIRDIGIRGCGLREPGVLYFLDGLFNGEGYNAVYADENLCGGLRGEAPLYDKHKISVS